MSGSQGARSQYSKLSNCDMSEANMRAEIRPRNDKWKIENASVSCRSVRADKPRGTTARTEWRALTWFGSPNPPSLTVT